MLQDEAPATGGNSHDENAYFQDCGSCRGTVADRGIFERATGAVNESVALVANSSTNDIGDLAWGKGRWSAVLDNLAAGKLGAQIPEKP